MQDRIEKQFYGFLKTPQLKLTTASFPYSPYVPSKMPQDLMLHKPQPTQVVLGKRMEEFFQHYVRYYSDQEILAHNEQIIHNKETLGEIDFLLKNVQSGEITQVELVYKFYLFDPEGDPEEFGRWIGPNKRDSLLKKLRRLQKRQFPLIFREETKPLLDRLGISAGEIIQKVCFKAWFFLPEGLPQEDYPEIDSEAVAGFYIKFREFSYDKFGRSLFFSPLKPNWPIFPEDNEEWMSFEDINKLILPLLTRKQSPLIWMKTSKTNFRRFFITWW